eukprot:GILK01007083.1.p1 GENE.GILK01007083.1~~GILK01007083.1.p1  ORF type:complete len:492 (-),score=38.94 GILK01007083.1:69-1502(-)
MADETDDRLQQQDEVMALLSIIGEDDVRVEPALSAFIDPDTASVIALKVSPALPPQFAFTFRCDDGDSTSKESRIIRKEISHLPPFHAKIIIPHNYPSAARPDIQLSCSWLEEKDMRLLQQQISSMWDPGCVVMYNWYLYLQDEALRFLGCGGLLDISDLPCSSQAAQELLKYDRERKEQIFATSEHTCGVCFDSKLGSSFFPLFHCAHLFCLDCLRSYLEVNIKDGEVANLCCPFVGCAQKLLPTEIKQLVARAHYDKFEDILLTKTLESMSDVVWCPVKDCRYPVLKEGRMAICSRCQHVFCAKCFGQWHPNSRCQNSALQFLKEDQIDNPVLQNEILTRKLLVQTTRKCPKCGAGIEKSEGCNHMHCTRCDAHFCWNCQSLISGYEHFQLGECALFWENRRVTTSQLEGSVQEVMGQFVDQLSSCPECGFHNLKSSDLNRLECVKCHHFYCWLCSDPCPEDDSHFAQSGCLKFS